MEIRGRLIDGKVVCMECLEKLVNQWVKINLDLLIYLSFHRFYYFSMISNEL
jgi:hypothetical protein